ncbi:MAG: CPBP family intramembrane metalloprotease [Gammaproteobacteria bacterium]|jgi:membrane protease YdiL (CAAX protease family)|nr:hypothetical protein [Chromatiales bacterium]MDP6673672.1 CPBP family intramembrane metalloprotease [Gammaproteobacteria bacterium]
MNKLVFAASAVAGGLVFFVSIVLFVVGVAQFNADSTPDQPWFPVVVWGLLFALLFWIDRNWDIGLRIPDGKPWGLIATFAVLSMLASHCLLVLEGAYHGITREFEAAPEGVSGFFALVYWVGIVVAMSTASESAFRGIMQSRLMPLVGVWPAIMIVTIANTLAHRWDGLAERAVGVFAILVAWGYLRHISGSLTPAILTHIAAIFIWDLILWNWGPWDHAAMGMGSLVTTTLIGLAALAGAVYVAKRI